MIFSRSVPLAELTSLRVGGRAAHVADARTPRDLEEALRFSHKRGVPHFILGEGTNVFASDRDFPGVVVRVKSRGVSLSRERGAVILEAAAGENFDRLIRRAVGLGLSGLENLSGIPGTAGATPIQNVGAYGVEIKDVVARVEALDAECGALRVFSPEECGFRYRASFFQSPAGKRFVITRVALRLSECFRPVLSYPELAARVSGRKLALRSVRRAILAIRRRKFPDLRQTGTAGSFFKNPVLSPAKARELRRRFRGIPTFPEGSGVKIPLAWILDRVLGLKGYRRGAASLYDAQPLVLVHHGGGSAEDIAELARDVARRVREATGIVIAPEVAYFNWGDATAS